MAKLPPPVSVGDEYLRAVLDEIKGLRADIASARAPAVVQNVGELREPEPPPDSNTGAGDRPAKSLLQRITGR